MTYTPEEVRALVQSLTMIYGKSERRAGEAIPMLTAYAALLERQAAGVTDAQVDAVINSVHAGDGMDGDSWDRLLVRAALLAVWPVAAELAQDKCFCDRTYPDSSPDASCGDCPTRDYKAAEPAQPADSGRVTEEMVRAACMANLNPLAEPSSTEMRNMRTAIAAALAAQGQGEGDAVTAIIRHVCETDPADPDKPDTVCIDVALLRSIVEQHITAPPAGVLYGCLMVQEAACVPHVHPEHGVGWFFSDRDVIEAGLVTQGHGEANAKHERELAQLIDERDRREEIIDCLCDAVLGQGRPEWSSAYSYDDALLEVQEAMFVEARAVPPLTDDQIRRHQLVASACPPGSMVLLVSAVQRLLAAAPSAPQEVE